MFSVLTALDFGALGRTPICAPLRIYFKRNCMDRAHGGQVCGDMVDGLN
jgi:hypothetical protein